MSYREEPFNEKYRSPGSVWLCKWPNVSMLHIHFYAGIGSAFLVGWDLKIFNVLAFYFVVKWFQVQSHDLLRDLILHLKSCIGSCNNSFT